jgi:hypothetical protein
MEGRIVAALAASLGALALAGDVAHAGPGGGEKPFPVDRTQILAGGGTTYVVEGRIHIGKTTEITVQKDTVIVGRGDGGGIIELEGQLEIHGVKGGEIPLQDITIELQPTFGNLHLDMVEFTDKSGGVTSPKDKAVDGRIFIENSTFNGKSTVDVTMSSNWIDLQRSMFEAPVRVKAVDPPGATANKVRLMAMNNASNHLLSGYFNGGLRVEHVFDVTVRTNILRGDAVSFVDCGSVAFDANYVTCKTLEFVQTVAGRFGKTTMSKCDVQCQKIALTAPVDPKNPDSMTCDKCWFGGETKEKAIREKFFVDHEKNAESGVTAKTTAVQEKPLQLAGTVQR